MSRLTRRPRAKLLVLVTEPLEMSNASKLEILEGGSDGQQSMASQSFS